MNYLLVNHIAAYAGQDAAHLGLPIAWARDVAAASRAARQAGVRLIVATPISGAAPTEETIELIPDDAGFEHVMLPRYWSARSFLGERSRLAAMLRTAITAADIVQLDLGGHPIPVGLVADPIARELGKPTLWMIDRLPDVRPGSRSRQLAKRAVGRTIAGSVRRSLSDALRSAGQVIATTSEIGDDLRTRSASNISVVESIDVRDDERPTSVTIAARHARLLDTTRPLTIAVLGEQTVERGTAHVLAAMHRCLRLSAAVKLIASSRGGEVELVRRHAAELGLATSVLLVDAPNLADADLVIDPALSNIARNDTAAIAACGLPVIAYSPRRSSPGVFEIERGAVDALAEELFQVATNRGRLATLLINGQAWAHDHTVDAAHRRRFALAREAVMRVRGTRGAA